MRKTIQIAVLLLSLFCGRIVVYGQEKTSNDPDAQLKESIYAKNKIEVLAYDKKDFDTLFFDFFQKQNDDKLTLTKEEFYNYTIKIAIYSEKLGLLYKEQKEESQRTKAEWFSKSYSEYLKSKR